MPPRKSAATGDYCSVYKYAVAANPPLARLFDETCTDRLAQASHGLLLPPADHLGAVQAMVDAEDYEGAEKAILRMVLYDRAASVAELKETGTRAGVALAETTGSGGAGTLPGGAEVRLAVRGRTTVWEASAPPPEAGPPFRRRHVRRARARGAEVVGGAASLLVLRDREALFDGIFGKFGRYVEERLRRGEALARDCFMEAAASLLQYMQHNCPGELGAVVPFLDADPAVSLYLLLLPYRHRGGLASDEAIAGWGGQKIYIDASREFSDFVRMRPADILAAGGEAAAYRSDAKVLLDAVDAARAQLTDRLTRETPATIAGLYDALAKDNAVGGVSPVLPSASLDLVERDPRLLQWMDEVRKVIHDAMTVARANPIYGRGVLESLSTTLRRCYPGDSPERELQITSLMALQSPMTRRENTEELWAFINSTHFLHTPVVNTPTSMVLEVPMETSLGRAYAATGEEALVYNAAAAAREYTSRVSGSRLPAPEFLKLLRGYPSTAGVAGAAAAVPPMGAAGVAGAATAVPPMGAAPVTVGETAGETAGE